MKLSFRQSLLILFLILTPLIISMLPFIIQTLHTPSDRIFMGLHRWSEDYYGYLHLINQGLMGHLQTVSKLTTIPHQPTFIHSEYAFLGLVGRLLGLNAPLTYHLSRLILGAIFLLVSFYFFFFLFSLGEKRQDPLLYAFIAFFLSFFLGSLPQVSFSPSSSFPFLTSHFSPPLSWWAELDIIRRSTILPHYLMGSILFLLILIFYLKLLKNFTGSARAFLNKNLKYLIYLAISSFFLSYIHPVNFLLLILTLLLFSIFSVFLNFPNSPNTPKFPNFIGIGCPFLLTFLVFLSGLPTFLYYRFALSLPFWRFILAHGITTQYNIPFFEFVMALGPTFFLAMGGTIVAFIRIRKLKKGKAGDSEEGSRRVQQPFYGDARRRESELAGPAFPRLELLLFSWLLAQSFFFLKLYEVFNFDRLRTMQAPYYIPLAFFSTLFIIHVAKIRWRRWQFFSIPIVIIIFLITFPLSIQSLKNQIYEVSDFQTFSPFIFPTKKQYQAWEFLRDHTPDNSIITASYEAKFLLPSVSGNKIAFGANFENDPNYNKNVDTINKIYQGILPAEQAQSFLKNNNISYVYWGYQEKSLGGDLSKYPFLQKIFENSEVTVFSTNPKGLPQK